MVDVARGADDVVVDEQGRHEPPVRADELATLVGFLDYQRETFAWKTRGVDDEGLRLSVGVSTMTLGGLIKHLAYVEDAWFSDWLHGNGKAAPWNGVDWRATPDWEFESAAADTPEQLTALWEAAVERSRSLLAEALERDGGLEQLTKRSWADGSVPSLRWVLVHMIEEYARHNGHADLMREAVDGETGE